MRLSCNLRCAFDYGRPQNIKHICLMLAFKYKSHTFLSAVRIISRVKSQVTRDSKLKRYIEMPVFLLCWKTKAKAIRLSMRHHPKNKVITTNDIKSKQQVLCTSIRLPFHFIFLQAGSTVTTLTSVLVGG
jgi:hypothetical protein